MCRCTSLMAESEEELKSLLIKVKEESEKAALKLNIQKTKIMAYGPITLWQIEEEKVETVTDFIFLGSKITVDGKYSHEMERCLLLGRKAMKNIDSILKSRDINLPTKVRLVKAMVFPVVMYGCEIWTIKKAGCQRTGAFKPFIYGPCPTSSDGLFTTPKHSVVSHRASLAGIAASKNSFPLMLHWL